MRCLEGGIFGALQNYEGCKLRKAHDRPHPSRELGTGEKVCLGRILVDLARPFQPTSLGGGIWNMAVVDEYSRKSWVEILRLKSDAAPRLKKWIAIW